MIKHSIRKLTPKIIKKIYRIIRAFKNVEVSPEINPKKFKEAKLFANRRLMVEKLFSGGNILEIGTESGKFAKFLLQMEKVEKVITVDIDYSLFELSPQEKLLCLKGRSSEVLPTLKKDFSLIYLDASHDYKNVKLDLISIEHLLKPGTILIFNDFSIMDKDFGLYGVHRAASEFINSNNCSVLGLAMQKNAQYDIAVCIN